MLKAAEQQQFSALERSRETGENGALIRLAERVGFEPGKRFGA